MTKGSPQESQRSAKVSRADAALDILGDLIDGPWSREHLSEIVSRWIESTLPASTATVQWGDLDSIDEQSRQRDPASHGRTMVYPIEHEGERLGEIRVEPLHDVQWTNVEDDAPRRWARAAGFFVAQRDAMEGARFLASRDELTGLYNRRFLRESLDEWIPRARQDRRPISVVMLDVDHFKSINDAWGHPTGDRVLRLIAELLQSSFRAQDVVCRYGGEEFCVLLCDNRASRTMDHPTEALFFAERVRRAAEAMRWTTADGQALSQVTISGGIATYPWDGVTAQELMQRADEALYAAKRSGRNQIQLAKGRRLAG